MSSVGVAERALSAVDGRTTELLLRGRARPLRRRGWLVRRALLAADLLGLAAAFVLAQALTGTSGMHDQIEAGWEYALFATSLPIWVVLAKLAGLYDRDEERADHSTADDLVGVFHLVTVSTWILLAITYWFPLADPNFPKMFRFWIAAVAFVTLARAGARSLCRKQVNYLQNTIILGAGVTGKTIARKLLKHPEYGINLVGFVDANPKERSLGLRHVTLLGDLDDLPHMVELLDVERVIVAFSDEEDAGLVPIIRNLNELDVQVDVVPRMYEVVSPGVDIHTVEGLPLMGLPPTRLSRSSRLLKRSMDLLGAVVGLTLLAPLFAVIALLIKRDSRGPVFFRQVRMAEGGCTFRIWKFRTMTDDADARKHEVAHLNKHLNGDARMFKIDDDPRVTRIGHWLRRFSLDELPQLFNVLVGEMSLVGPRPLILDEARHVDDWARRRLDLKPGMTGLWQVLGRDGIGFDEMVKLDYLYVTTWSLGGDLRLVLRTLPRVVRNTVPA